VVAGAPPPSVVNVAARAASDVADKPAGPGAAFLVRRQLGEPLLRSSHCCCSGCYCSELLELAVGAAVTTPGTRAPVGRAHPKSAAPGECPCRAKQTKRKPAALLPGVAAIAARRLRLRNPALRMCRPMGRMAGCWLVGRRAGYVVVSLLLGLPWTCWLMTRLPECSALGWLAAGRLPDLAGWTANCVF